MSARPHIRLIAEWARRVVPISLTMLLLSCAGAKGPAVREDPGIAKGRSLYDIGQYEKAEVHFRELLISAGARGDSLLAAQACKWIGNILLAYEKDDEAMRWYERSLGMFGRILDTQPAAEVKVVAETERDNVRSNITAVFRNRGRYREAIALLTRVLDEDQARGEPLRIAVSLYNLAILHDNITDTLVSSAEMKVHLDSARILYRRSLAVYPTADAWLGFGNNFARTEQLDSAVVCYRRAESLYRASGFRIHQAMCLGNIGILDARMQHPDDAIDALRHAVDIIEELRGNLASIDVRSSFISNKFYIYENLIGLLVRQGRTEEAFEYVERAKARSFLDMIGNKSVGGEKLRSPEAQSLVDEEHALQERMARIIEMPDSTEVLGLVVRRHQDVLAELKKLDPEYASVKSITPVPLRELQALLDDSTAVLEYYLGDESAFVFLVRPHSVVVRPLNVKSSRKLESSIEALRRSLYQDFPAEKIRVLREARLRDGKSPAEATQIWMSTVTKTEWQYTLLGMYSLLIGPVDSELTGVHRLYVVPHGPLHHLPFGALVQGGDVDKRKDAHIVRPRYLIERMAIAYLPSASVLPFALKRRGRDTGNAMIVGDPVYADPVYRKHPLQNALVEADSVARFVKHPLLLVREAAEESRVKSEIGERGLVHFATHGELSKKDPMKSRILLAAAHPAGDNDGSLTVGEVFNLDLHAQLVTLSACQTAQVQTADGGFTAGDDLVGLTRSFLFAGTPSVIATLWYVDDAATLAWMDLFYRSWLSGGAHRIDAARQAVLDMLAQPGDPDWIHPFFWGAFIYFGAMQ